MYLICCDFCILAKHQISGMGVNINGRFLLKYARYRYFPELAVQVIPKRVSPTVMSAVGFGEGGMVGWGDLKSA